MSRRSLNATVVLGALALCACAVYSPNDLVGNGGSFADGGLGGVERGGSSGAGGSAALGGAGTGGSFSGGSAGEASGGGGASSAGGESTGGSNPIGGTGASSGGKGGTGGASDTGGSAGSVASGGVAGSSGGSVAGGGSATTGGAATGGSPTLDPELIDDMEDGNQNIHFHEMRNGAWYTAAGKDATADPAPMKAFTMAEIVGTPGVAGSTLALHFKGSGGSEWGAMAAFDFHAAATPKVVYDASAYKGITFWVKAEAASKIVVRVPIKNTSVAAEGACVAMTNGCENHYSAPLNLTTAWKQVTLLWAAFTQDPAWGFQTAFAPTELVSVQFLILSAVAPATPPSADFWIDDVSFVP